MDSRLASARGFRIILAVVWGRRFDALVVEEDEDEDEDELGDDDLVGDGLDEAPAVVDLDHGGHSQEQLEE